VSTTIGEDRLRRLQQVGRERLELGLGPERTRELEK
jgi:hypothetical protein